MPFPLDTRRRADLSALLQDCVEGTSCSRGAVVMESGGGPFVYLLSGFRSRQELQRAFKTDGRTDLWKRLESFSRGKRRPPAEAPLVISLRTGRKETGFLILFKPRGKNFSREDRRTALHAVNGAARYLELYGKLSSLQRNYLNTILVLLKTLEDKDQFSRGHSSRVAEYCRKAGSAVGLSKRRMETLRWAALFHDIGKVGIVDAILQKKAQLSPSEMAIVREHPVIGQRIVQDLDILREASRIIRAHHERFDGKGYPDMLAGRNIPLPARILALAESFDTITSHTPYRSGRPVEVAARELRKEKGRQFDPELVDPFLEAVLF